MSRYSASPVVRRLDLRLPVELDEQLAAFDPRTGLGQPHDHQVPGRRCQDPIRSSGERKRAGFERLDRAVQAQGDTVTRHARRQCRDQGRQGQTHPGRGTDHILE